MKHIITVRNEDGTYSTTEKDIPLDETDPQVQRCRAMAAMRPGEMVVGVKAEKTVDIPLLTSVVQEKQIIVEREDYLSDLSGGSSCQK